MALIRIKNLLLRTYIGFNPEEIENKQDVIINIEIETVLDQESFLDDNEKYIYDYKIVTKQIISLVQEGRFKLLEFLTKNIVDTIMLDNRVKRVKVEVDKPHALRFAQSVSIEMEAKK